MRRIVPASLAALAIAAVALAPHAASGVAAAAAATPTPAATAKDPCGATKSKWAHMQCQQFNNSAPGDEYFGRMKISYLGIDNTFKDGSISAGAYTTDAPLIAKLMFADEALQRWASKYPGDPQLARSYFLGYIVFHKVYTQPGQQMAWHYLQTLIAKYPQTYFGKTAKTTVANGYIEHWLASPEPCPTPLPKGVKPQNTPGATATPQTPAGQPAVNIITPPCIAPTPEPAASGSPSAAPAKTPH